MRARMIVSATVATLSFATFAGCTQEAPVHRATAACTPKTATIVWDAAAPAADALIGVYRLTWSKSDAVWHSEFTPIVVKPIFEDDALMSELRATPDLKMVWEQALLVDARRTGQVGTAFGTDAKVDDPDRPPAVPTRPAPGTFVAAVNVNQKVMPFTIHCATGKQAVGSVVAPVIGGYWTFISRCGDKRYLGQPAQAYCADGQASDG